MSPKCLPRSRQWDVVGDLSEKIRPVLRFQWALWSKYCMWLKRRRPERNTIVFIIMKTKHHLRQGTSTRNKATTERKKTKEYDRMETFLVNQVILIAAFRAVYYVMPPTMLSSRWRDGAAPNAFSRDFDLK